MTGGLAAALLALVVLFHQAQVILGQGGSWQLMVKNSGLSSMHTVVTHLNTVVFLERTNQGATSLLLPGVYISAPFKSTDSRSELRSHSLFTAQEAQSKVCTTVMNHLLESPGPNLSI